MELILAGYLLSATGHWGTVAVWTIPSARWEAEAEEGGDTVNRDIILIPARDWGQRGGAEARKLGTL